VVTLRDVSSGAIRAEFETSLRSIRSLAYSPDGRTLAITGIGGIVLLWDLAANREKLRFRSGTGDVNVAAFAADGRTIASAGREGTIALWEAETGRLRTTLAGHPRKSADKMPFLHALAFSPDGATLASAVLFDPEVKLWDVATGHLRAILRTRNSISNSLAFSPDGRVLATTGFHALHLWDVATGRERPGGPSLGGPFSAATFSPDGTWLVLGGINGEVSLWEMAQILPPPRLAVTEPTIR
jgi:WD40 repeat protein